MVVVDGKKMNKKETSNKICNFICSEYGVKNVRCLGNPYNSNVFKIVVDFDDGPVIYVLENCTDNVIDYIISEINKKCKLNIFVELDRFW